MTDLIPTDLPLPTIPGISPQQVRGEYHRRLQAVLKRRDIFPDLGAAESWVRDSLTDEEYALTSEGAANRLVFGPFQDRASGTWIPHFQFFRPCDQCDSGRHDGVCWYCSGTGAYGRGGVLSMGMGVCQACHGTGEDAYPCEACNGKGEVEVVNSGEDL